MLKALIVVLVLYLILVGGGCVVQRRLIYFPERIPMQAAEQLAAQQGLEAWRNRDGEVIGWRERESAQELPRLLVMHGNAGHALHRRHYIDLLGDAWEVLLLEYPGYGVRGGRPSEPALLEAASEAVEQLRSEDADTPVYLLGESLGSGVACGVAGERPQQIAGLILITPFNSLTEVAAGHFPFLPVRFILRDRYDNVKSLQAYDGPVFVLLAGNDEVVPTRHGEALYNAYDGPKEKVLIEGAGHNTVLSATTAAEWRRLISFFQE
ncbi:MAG: alpha/beta hydrolase [Spirochaetaceae bacterium]|nr:MAG: alpha/beta hydrolase [Spirochaetaceae bacterium]